MGSAWIWFEFWDNVISIVGFETINLYHITTALSLNHQIACLSHSEQDTRLERATAGTTRVVRYQWHHQSEWTMRPHSTIKLHQSIRWFCVAESIMRVSASWYFNAVKSSTKFDIALWPPNRESTHWERQEGCLICFSSRRQLPNREVDSDEASKLFTRQVQLQRLRDSYRRSSHAGKLQQFEQIRFRKLAWWTPRSAVRPSLSS